MKQRLRRWALLAFAVVLAAVACRMCSTGVGSAESQNNLNVWMQNNGKVKVLSTTCIIGDLVERIGGPHIDHYCLIGPELDPHSYQLVKGDNEKLSFADVIFFNGLGLEHGPSLHRYLDESDKATAVGDGIAKVVPDEILYYSGQSDPHIWMDASLWAHVAPQVVQVLSERDPEHASEYKANGKSVQRAIEDLHDELGTIMASVPDEDRYLVTSHDAFNYFARAYLGTKQERSDDSWQLRFEAPEGLAPDSQLSATDIQDILDHMIKYNVTVIFPESNVSKDSLRKLEQAANERGLKVKLAREPLYGDAMGKPGSDGDSYLKMLRHNAEVITGQLRR